MNNRPPFEREELLMMLPHRPPFLFVDRVTSLDPHKAIVAERLLRGEESYFAGHFPGRPIMPGVLIAEALAQASGLLLGLSEHLFSETPPEKPRVYLLAVTHFKFTHPAGPGDTLTLRSSIDRSFGALFNFNAEAAVGGKTVAAGALTLALMA